MFRACCVFPALYFLALLIVQGKPTPPVDRSSGEKTLVYSSFPFKMEEGAVPSEAFISIFDPKDHDLRLYLKADPPGLLSIPPFVTIPAGEERVRFFVSAPEDNLLTHVVKVAISVTNTDVRGRFQKIYVHDNDRADLVLNIPSTVKEGDPPGKGKISLSKVAGVPLTASLSSTSASRITVPQEVIIPAGKSSAVFTYKVGEKLSQESGAVTINLRVPGSARTSKTVAYQGRVEQQLSIGLIGRLWENTTASAVVILAKAESRNITVSLSSNRPDLIQVPAQVTIPRGRTRVAFSFFLPDDKSPESQRQIILNASADGFAKATRVVSFINDDPSGYSITTDSDFPTFRKSQFKIRAFNAKGTVMENAKTTFNLLWQLSDGTTYPTNIQNQRLFGGIWIGVVEPPPPGKKAVRLQLVDSNGITARGDLFGSMLKLEIGASQCVWDATRQLLVGSVITGKNKKYDRSIVWINPASGKLVSALKLRFPPDRIALASGGRYLYVNHESAGMISRIDLSKRELSDSFRVVSADNQPLKAIDILPVPGAPERVIAAIHFNSPVDGKLPVIMFVNGKALANDSVSFGHFDRLIASSRPNEFLGLSNSQVFKFTYGNDGITGSEFIPYLTVNTNQPIHSDGKMFGSEDGVLYDVASGIQLAKLPSGWGICPDSANGRVYRVENNDRGLPEIRAYDNRFFRPLNGVNLPNLNETFYSHDIHRWGSNGLALLTGRTIVLIEDPSLVPAGVATDLGLKVTAPGTAATSGVDLTYTVEVTHRGKQTATDARVEINLSAGQTFIAASPSVGGIEATGSLALQWSIGNMTPGSTVRLKVRVRPLAAGSISCGAFASSSMPDPSIANNRDAATAWVDFQNDSEFFKRLDIQPVDIISDRKRGWIWATIPASRENVLSKSLVSIDPENGKISAPIPLLGDPVGIRLREGGDHVHVWFKDAASIQRIHLPSRRTDFVTPTILPVEDMEVLDGRSNSLIVSARNRKDTESSVIFAMDGLDRRQTVTSLISPVQFHKTEDARRFLVRSMVANDHEWAYLQLNASGVKQAESIVRREIQASESFMDAGGMIFYSSGDLVEKKDMKVIGGIGRYTGHPLIAPSRQSAFFLSWGNLFALNLQDLNSRDSLKLPKSVEVGFDNAKKRNSFIEWGTDGFAVIDDSNVLQLFNWAPSWGVGGKASRASMVSFGSIDGNSIGSSPTITHSSPVMDLMQIGTNHFMRMRFERPTRPYAVYTSTDLIEWQPAVDYTEAVIQSLPAGKVMIQASFRRPGLKQGFARIQWLEGP